MNSHGLGGGGGEGGSAGMDGENRNGKPRVTSVTIILFNLTFRQTSTFL